MNKTRGIAVKVARYDGVDKGISYCKKKVLAIIDKHKWEEMGDAESRALAYTIARHGAIDVNRFHNQELEDIKVKIKAIK